VQAVSRAAERAVHYYGVCMYVCMWFQQLQSCKAAGSHTAVWGQSETETQGFKQLMTLYAGLPAARGKILIEMYVIQNR